MSAARAEAMSLEMQLQDIRKSRKEAVRTRQREGHTNDVTRPHA